MSDGNGMVLSSPLMISFIVVMSSIFAEHDWVAFQISVFKMIIILLILGKKYIIKPDIFLSTEQQNTAHFELNRVFVWYAVKVYK